MQASSASKFDVLTRLDVRSKMLIAALAAVMTIALSSLNSQLLLFTTSLLYLFALGRNKLIFVSYAVALLMMALSLGFACVGALHSFHGQKPGTRFFVHSVPESPDSDEHNSADGFYRQTAEHSERSSAAQAPVHYLSSSRCDYSFYSDVCRRCETNLGISEDQGLQDQSLAVHDSSDSHHPPAFYAAPFQST